jgi:hypothetical protein
VTAANHFWARSGFCSQIFTVVFVSKIVLCEGKGVGPVTRKLLAAEAALGVRRASNRRSWLE